MATASAAGFSDLVVKLQAQVDDMQRNMADYEAAYTQSVQQLAGLNSELVDEMMAAHLQSYGRDKQELDLIRADRNILLEQRSSPRMAELISRCQQ
ncbi:hypothetical protein QTI24_29670 [Variovorax sp. J22P240]|uniref:hypothetical protein n=1 Tax=Variovorax sp. J22P240 TaxID=3053514 RepID=UPI0025774DBD|nr:hypothetical protein [Variovorax sp. J22P240]MDM0002795.1 hypothetical protein [Variovorax sp. J22P240]